MTQANDITLSPNITGTAQRTELNDILEAIVTGHTGASRPSYLPAFAYWTQAVSSTIFERYFYDGTNDILVGTFDAAANTYTPSGQLGTFGNTVEMQSGNFTAEDSDFGRLFKVDATSNPVVVNLADTNALAAGWFIIVQKADATANAVVIDPDGADTINGTPTYTLARNMDSVIIIKASSNTLVALPMANGGALAPLISPTLTGNPTAPTQAAANNSTRIANTEFVQTAISNLASTYAALTSPTLTGTPTAPSAPISTNTDQIATTAFVQAVKATISSVQEANAAEVAAATDVSKYVAPDMLHLSPSAVTASAYFTFTNTNLPATLHRSRNIASIDRNNNVGAYRVHFANPMPDLNYIALGIATSNSGVVGYFTLRTATTGIAARTVNYSDLLGAPISTSNFYQIVIFGQ